MNELDKTVLESCVLQDIKKEHISPESLDELAQKMGSYEALFSRKSQQYRAQGLHERTLSEADYRTLILSHYTFLKRPVMLIGEKISVGSQK
jgi:arsenate reductase